MFNPQYLSDYEAEQKAKRLERERRDLEYDLDEAREKAERAARRFRLETAARKKELARAREEAQQSDETAAELNAQCEDLQHEVDLAHQWLMDHGHWAAALQHEVDLAHQWLMDHGHWAAFDEWASHLRRQ